MNPLSKALLCLSVASSGAGCSQSVGFVPADGGDEGPSGFVVGRVVQASSIEWSAGFAPGGVGCSLVGTAGDCILATCPVNDVRAMESAGVISITGGDLSTPVELRPDAIGVYASEYSDHLVWQNDVPITFASTGNSPGVPPFSETVAPPPRITFTSTSSGSAPEEIDRNHDLMVRWTGAAAGPAEAVVLLRDSTQTAVIGCRFSVGSGVGAVPASVLDRLTPGNGRLDLSVETSRDVSAGAYRVRLTLQVPPDAVPASRPIVLR